MTHAVPFHCPDCQEVIRIQFQIDESINWRNWPINIECPGCGGLIEVEYSKEKGLVQRNDEDGRAKKALKMAKDEDSGCMIGYSDLLPTPKSMYYVPFPSAERSVFTSLFAMLGDPRLISIYGGYARKISEGILRYRFSMPALYSMLKGDKTHVKAFNSKIKDTLDIRPGEYYEEAKTPDDCYELFRELHNTLRNSMDPNGADPTYPFFKNLWATLVKLDGDAIEEVMSACDINTTKMSGLRKDAYKRVHENLKNLQKLIPSVFLDFIPKALNKNDELFLMTAKYEDVNDLYEDNYAVIMKFMPLVIAAYNKVRNGDCNAFVDNNGNPLKYTIADFIKLQDGQRINAVNSIDKLRDVFSDVINNHIRNGIDHYETDYDQHTQTLTYKYENNRGTASETHRLIDVAHMCMRQFRVLCWLLWFADKPGRLANP